MTDDDLLKELVRATHGIGNRLRLAVTAAEYIQLRECLLRRDGRFHGRIQNITLTIDDDPGNTPLIAEFPAEKP